LRQPAVVAIEPNKNFTAKRRQCGRLCFPERGVIITSPFAPALDHRTAGWPNAFDIWIFGSA
jgi:hypothetical protein